MVNVSTLGQFLDQIARLKAQQQTLGDLTVQISSGHKTQSLSGLGNDIIKTVRARTGVNNLDTYNLNITNATRRINLMNSSINEIQTQANSVIDSLTVAVQQGDYPDLPAIQDLAGKVLDYIKNLMNSTDGDRYLFGGADTTEPPIGTNGLFDSALGEFVPDSSDLTMPPLVASGMIGDWGDGTITTDQFIASYHAIDDTVLGFSNALTTNTAGKSAVRVDDKSEFDYTVLANKTKMKEIVRALGVLVSLPPVDYAPGALNDPTATTIAGDTAPYPPKEKQQNFFEVLNDLSTTLRQAVDGLDDDQFKLSLVQAQIGKIKDSHTDQINTFKNVIDDAENTDITEASGLLTQLQVQLQASFQVTALMSQLTLANFLNN